MSGPARDPLARLAVRAPALARLGIRFAISLPRSRLRTRLWQRGMLVGFGASDRRDWAVINAFMSPDVRIDLDRAGGWRLGFEREYRGRDGYIQWFNDFTGVFAGWDTSDLEVVAPRGNRVLVISRPRAQGIASGLPVTGELWAVFTYERGLAHENSGLRRLRRGACLGRPRTARAVTSLCCRAP